MKQDDLIRIKHFIRVSFEIEEMLHVSSLQKKILLKALELWERQPKPTQVSQLAVSVEGISERSVYRHLKILTQKNWLKLSNDKRDQRIKLVEPSNHLLKSLSLKI